MANIELPKDAEGREIPLDTVALYDDDGNVHSIRRFIYTNDFDLNDKWINSWIAVVDDYKVAKPEQMHLTKPDSWEKLLEDLDRCADVHSDVACAYFNMPESNDCTSCIADESSNCKQVFIRNIASRIRKLSGEDE